MNTAHERRIETSKRFYRQIEDIIVHKAPSIYTGAIFTFLAVALFGWYAIRPTLQTILFLRREIADNKVVNTQMEEKISRLIEAQAKYQSVAAKLPLVDESLPREARAIDVTYAMRNMASATGASVSGVSVGSTPLFASASAKPQTPVLSAKSSVKVADASVSIQMTGTYLQFREFLNKAVLWRRLVTIESIKILPNESGQSGGGPLQMTMKGQFHYLTE